MMATSAGLEVNERVERSAPASLRLGVATCRAEAFKEIKAMVERLGGDSTALLARFQIEPTVLDDPNGIIPYRSMVRLLEQAATELKCPDFGMQLAALQGTSKIVGPLGVAMRNSATLGDAFRYCADNHHVFSHAIELTLEKLPASSKVVMRFGILLERLPNQRQAIEHALLSLHNATPTLSGGQAHVREVWVTHEPLAPPATYRAHFAARLRFGQPINALVFEERDLELPVPNTNRQLYVLATNFIDYRFPRSHKSLSERVHTLIRRLLREGECSQERVADALGLHTRTLQRRLKEEGESFETIKDNVRREAALLYLRQLRLPLVQVAAALGYAELSTLSRSCYRWFAASPRRLRSELRRAEQPETDGLDQP